MESKKNNKEMFLGTDLGTTTTQVAVLDRTGVVKVLPNMDGELATQSIISVADNKSTAGSAAKPDKFLNPDMVAEQFKKSMDKVTETGKPIIIVISPDGTEYTPVTLSAELLRYIKESAEKIEGQEFKKAAISVPAYFEYRARQATKDAGLIAGFEEVLVVDEPTAAATYYGLVKPCKQRIAVFDFGGGTFDISILQVEEDGNIDPIAVDGDPECGGSNIDEAMFQQVRKLYEEKGSELSPEKDMAEWLEVLDECKQAKETLARKDAVVIPLKIGDERTSMEVTYEQLKEYSADVIQILRSCCQRALDKAGFTPAEIDKVLIVGGSSRLRFVPEIVKDIFGKYPVTDTDPDLAVAKGNAIIAVAHFSDPDQQINVEGTRYLASDIEPHQIAARDLCVAAITKREQDDMKEYNVPIIAAGSRLPFGATETFTPIDSHTTAVTVKLIDGKPGELSSNYSPLEEAEVEVKPTDESNNKERIQFKIGMDTEALVSIEVCDKLLKKPIPIKFRFHSGLSDSDIQQMRTQLESRHKDDSHRDN